MQEYYPHDFERLKRYVAAGRWHRGRRHARRAGRQPGLARGADPADPLRQPLLRARAGPHDRCDLFLPDCFGFGWALPSVAAHCGLTGFSAQKFRKWGGENAVRHRAVARPGRPRRGGGAAARGLRRGPRRGPLPGRALARVARGAGTPLGSSTGLQVRRHRRPGRRPARGGGAVDRQERRRDGTDPGGPRRLRPAVPRPDAGADRPAADATTASCCCPPTAPAASPRRRR